MTFTRMNDQELGGARGGEYFATGADCRLQPAYVVAQRFAKAAWLKEIALHVNDHERGSIDVDPERGWLRLDVHSTHGVTLAFELHASAKQDRDQSAVLFAASGLHCRKSIARQDHVLQDRIDLAVPTLAAEDAVMANPGLHVVTLAVRPQT